MRTSIRSAGGMAVAVCVAGFLSSEGAARSCPGDTNGDNVVDVNDVNNVILDWGTDGTVHGGDIAGPVPESGPDGRTNVNDLNAVIAGWGACPLANGDCVDRGLITGTVWPGHDGFTEFDSVGATLDPTAPEFSCGIAVNDVWFDYITPPHVFQGGGQLHIATCGSTYDTVIEVYAGHACPPETADSLVCIDDGGVSWAGDCTGTLQGSGIIVGLSNDMPLKIRIGGWLGNAEGVGSLNLVWQHSLPPPQTNDSCASAIGHPDWELVSGGPALGGETYTASHDAEASVCGVPPEARGTWYWLTGDGTRKDVRVTCSDADASYRLDVFCVPYDCEKLWCLGADFDECIGPNRNVAPIATFCTEPDAVYAVLVSSEEDGLFEVSMTGNEACGPPNACGAPSVSRLPKTDH